MTQYVFFKKLEQVLAIIFCSPIIMMVALHACINRLRHRLLRDGLSNE